MTPRASCFPVSLLVYLQCGPPKNRRLFVESASIETVGICAKYGLIRNLACLQSLVDADNEGTAHGSRVLQVHYARASFVRIRTCLCSVTGCSIGVVCARLLTPTVHVSITLVLRGRSFGHGTHADGSVNHVLCDATPAGAALSLLSPRETGHKTNASGFH